MDTRVMDHCPDCGEEYPRGELAEIDGYTPCCAEQACPGDTALARTFIADGWIPDWGGDAVTSCCRHTANLFAWEHGRRIVAAA
jgi:hypothetical protein